MTDSPSRAYADGRAAWPELELPADAFADYLGAHPGGAIDGDSIDADRAAELYLACACGRGEPRALAELDAIVASAVPTAVAHMGLDSHTVDDLQQVVRDKLLVGDPPRLLGYAGRGRLRGLIKVIAVRAAISGLRKARREVGFGDGELERLPDGGVDPALQLMKESYRAAFKQAFEAAVRELDSRQRNLLRLHLLGGVTLDKLAGIYGVHRATVVRWLARAREAVFTGTRARMAEQLGIAGGELDSVMGLIQSRLDASVQKVLRTLDERAPTDAGD